MVNEEKTKQLGMSLGKATYILTKSIIFKLLCDLGRNKCYRCGGVIATADDMHKDHIVDWLHSDDPQGKFFDVENVAFSHSKCNLAAERKHRRCRVGPSGFRGVRKERRATTKPWRARMFIERKAVDLGAYPTAREAAFAYDTAVIARFGLLAVTNQSLGLIKIAA